jgi:hypothetical protein
MTPERWQRVEQLLHSALKLGEKARADFLKQACDGDETLRGEVQSLLEHKSEAKTFIEVPALEMVAKEMAEEPDRIVIGRQIGAYKITSLLGAGGMGRHIGLKTHGGAGRGREFCPRKWHRARSNHTLSGARAHRR